MALLGPEDAVHRAFAGAGWHPADPVTLRNGLRVGVAVMFGRPYPRAPVSSVFLFDRRQDMAYQREAGRSARRRHHVRLWRAHPDLVADGVFDHGVSSPATVLWIGAATFDRRISVSRRSGRITHRIDPDVDRERRFLVADLASAGGIRSVRLVDRGGPRAGRNVAGHPFYTDGQISLLELRRV